MKPTISIVTPSYNQGEFLEDCITSVIEQGYPELEYLIIDGGSKDQSVEIIKKYENHLSYWVTEPDKGQTDAINKGFRRAKGEIVAWLNADDYYLPDALKKVAEVYNQHPDASFFFGNGLRVSKNKKLISRYFIENEVRFNHQALLYGLNYILQPSTFINRKFLVQVNYLNSDLKFGMDTDLWIRLSMEAEPVPIQADLAASREYQTTKSKSVFFSRVEELRKIAEEHTGLEITPGVVCYYLDTLSRYLEEYPGIFSPSYKKNINTFWSATATEMAKYSARADGSPMLKPSATLQNQITKARLKSIRPTGNQEVRDHPIGIELRQVTLGKSGGLALYLRSLLDGLFKINPDQEYIVYSTIFNSNLLQNEYKNVAVVTLPTSTYFNQLSLEIQARGIQVLFRTYPIVDDLNLPFRHQVFLVPDLQHEFYPEYFDQDVLKARRDAFNLALSRAGAIATLTEFTRKTILDHPATSCKEVILVKPALQLDFLEPQRELYPEEEVLIPDVPFFYFPANIWPHKNHHRILEAFDNFIKAVGKPFNLVLTGHQEGWEDLMVNFPGRPIQHLGFVSTPVVHQLYKNSSALIFFTLYEGFGMPLLEAFAMGTPVICSDVTSLPEVGGKAVLYCDPTDVSEMTALMTRIAQDELLRDKLVKAGKQQLKKFSWEKSALNLYNALKKIAMKTLDSQMQPKVREEETIKSPLVSIVTPSYNQGKFISRTIESVLNQTYQNIEYIVIDGGSSDETVEILKSYGDKFKWISEPDRGQSHAINKGFTRSRGEIRGFLNSDDILEVDAVEKVVNYFQEYPQCDMVYGRAYYIDDENQITGMYNTDEYSFTRLMQDCCICQPAAFWRTSIADRVGVFDESLNMALDYDYWLRIDRAGGVIHHVSYILASSRLYPETKTLSSREQSYREAFYVCQQHGGYVDLNYFYGLWDHLIWKKKSGLPHYLLRWPNSYIYIAKLHHKIYHLVKKIKAVSDLGKIRRFRSVIKQKILHQLKRYLGFSRPLVRKYRSLVFKVNRRQPVFGYWSDNWLAPVVQFFVKNKMPGQQLYIEGIPVVDMEVRVKVERKTIYTQRITGGKNTKLEVPAQDGERITIIFSNPVLDPSNRYLSFLVEGTNLFTEEDPISL